jgi:hypothetical protein
MNLRIIRCEIVGLRAMAHNSPRPEQRPADVPGAGFKGDPTNRPRKFAQHEVVIYGAGCRP